MELSKIIADLRNEGRAIDSALRTIERLMSGHKRPYHRRHWTQRPENRAKVRRVMRAALKARKAKA